jgi:phosphopantothenoylcysteine decarboxylase/phosphopantothenate--cysteine ligase
MLHGKKIVLGVTGSIAAYKAALLVRLLKKQGAEVSVVMTASASDFISPLTLATLSGNPVQSAFTSNPETGVWNNHVELGMWADLMVIAPATANTIGKMANGICDNLLMAVYLSAKCPVLVAPAMDLDMYRHSSVKSNLEKLSAFGNQVMKAGYGELASGLTGEGRMPEPEEILEAIEQLLSKKKVLKGKKILITAGPTYEMIDPVRFIGNFSTGKMGIHLAEEAYVLGAEVVLVCGPSSVSSSSGIQRINVTSAAEMLQACEQHFDTAHVAILSAAVADYRPVHQAVQKIKKHDASMQIELESTPDILKTLGGKKQHQILVGFALETNNELEHATKKLQSKNLDFIVLNSLQDKGAGFGHDTNKVSILHKSNKISRFELKSKQEVARDILQEILPMLS